jgi:hypothetical protein
MSAQRGKGNILTFILFLEQLKLDFNWDDKPVLTLKKFVQTELEQLWSNLGQPNELRPRILIENLDRGLLDAGQTNANSDQHQAKAAKTLTIKAKKSKKSCS